MKTFLLNYIFLFIIMFLNPTLGSEEAGDNQIPVRLVQNANKKFQFVDSDKGTPLVHHETPCLEYNSSDLEHHLYSTQYIYDGAIRQVIDGAFKNIISVFNEEYVREDVIVHLLGEFVKYKGLSIPEQNLYDTFKYYMTLSQAVYTDFNTRDFLVLNGSIAIEKKWDDIIYSQNKIVELISWIETIQQTHNAPEAETHKNIPGLLGGKILVPREERLPKTKKDFSVAIGEINDFLRQLGRPSIIDEENLEDVIRDLKFQHVISKLRYIQTEIDSQYSWHFEADRKEKKVSDEKEIKAFIKKLGGQVKSIKDYQPIPEYKGHQLTARAVISSSFLSKAGLLEKDNITILNVGFRNQEEIGSLWNKFATALMGGKKNPLAWFQKFGEVDHIAYIEEDLTEEKKDKIIIVYSGSNSAIDWGNDLTIGHGHWRGLSVHEGISWLFNTSVFVHHRVLQENINNYYKNHCSPNKLEVVTTGHSLGGGLAELAAFYYSEEKQTIFSGIIDPKKVSVKTFTFAAPAIIHRKSKRTFQEQLGLENIHRIWVKNDPVVNWSGEESSVQKVLQGSVHVGNSFVLHYNLPRDTFDWWGPHGINRYLSHLEAYVRDVKKLMPFLSDYIKKTHLDTYTINRLKLLSIIERIKGGKDISEDISLHQGLAEHIITYSPQIHTIAPFKTVGDAYSHSPRYAL